MPAFALNAQSGPLLSSPYQPPSRAQTPIVFLSLFAFYWVTPANICWARVLIHWLLTAAVCGREVRKPHCSDGETESWKEQVPHMMMVALAEPGLPAWVLSRSAGSVVVSLWSLYQIFKNMPILWVSIFNSFFFFGSIVDLQCCVHFRCIAKWFSYIYIHTHTYIYISNDLAI